jgi:hypothetical protein
VVPLEGQAYKKHQNQITAKQTIEFVQDMLQ